MRWHGTGVREVAVLQRRQQWLLRGVLQRESELAVHTFFRRECCSGFNVSVCQSGQLFAGVDDHRAIDRGLANLLAELGCQRGKFAVDLFDALALFIIEQCARLNHIGIGALQKNGIFALQAERLAIIVDRFDAREEARIEIDRVRVRGQQRADFGIDFVQPVGCV